VKVEIVGEDQFTMGPIPDYELTKPALDRYRDYAGIGSFDMAYFETPPFPIPTPKLEEPARARCPQIPPPVQQEVPPEMPPEVPQEVPQETPPEKPAEVPPEEPAEMPVEMGPCPEVTPAPSPKPPPTPEPAYDKGPIPQYRLSEPALDRYRDYAGIGPFELSPALECDHEPLCRCMFCSMKEGRSQKILIDPEGKPACDSKAKPADIDPLKVFEDSPVYHEEKIRDDDAYRGEGLRAVEPFGEVFQQEKQFEEDVFEPEYPFGDKTFMQEHPLFGDFGVKAVAKAKVVKDEQGRELAESPECDNTEALDDPEAEEKKGEEEETGKEEIFDDKAFDEPPKEETEQAFEKQDFETPEQAEETTQAGGQEPENTETAEDAQ